MSGFGRFIRALLPGLAGSLWDNLPLVQARRDALVFRGVYSDFSQVPVVGPGFGSDIWTGRLRAASAEIPSAAGEQGLAPHVSSPFRALMPLVFAAMPPLDRPVTLLDFGGGDGADYRYLRALVTSERPVDYHVVELSNVCAAGGSEFLRSDSIRFHQGWPKLGSGVDIAFSDGALQFCENYRSVIERLVSYAPGQLLLVNLPAGDVETFATAWLGVPGSSIPWWFFNITEIRDILHDLGYDLMFQCSLGGGGLRNFPPSRRIRGGAQLLFTRRPAHRTKLLH